MNEGLLRVRAVFFGLITAALLLGAAPSGAQDPPSPDAYCLAECTALSPDQQFCERACSVNPQQAGRVDDRVDWRCMNTCRERGGRYAQCRPNCVRR